MATNYGILGQTADASTEVTLYTVPADTFVKVRIVVANRGSAATYRIALLNDGGTTANEDYVAYDAPLGANETLTSTTFTLNPVDEIKVESSSATVSFTAFGIEQDST